MDSLIQINHFSPSAVTIEEKFPYYFIILFDGTAAFTIDFTGYECKGKSLLFLSPYQLLSWQKSPNLEVTAIQFHGDFYCIEYHKKEVACNGILFNNIYQQPFVCVSEEVYGEIQNIASKMQNLISSSHEYDISVLKSYLQLILALSSKEKQQNTNFNIQESRLEENALKFQALLEEHFRIARDVAFYASRLGVTVDTLSKRVKKQFGKTPSKLIQERIALESKKLLHLTYKSIKEIAAELNFRDEFYFSRYFKKEVGISPKNFREGARISVVAKKSM